MAEPDSLKFDLKEVATALVRQADLHCGVWGLVVEFGFGAANIGQSTEPGPDARPGAVVAVLSLGLQEAPKESSTAVDAAKVNPDETARGKGRKSKSATRGGR